MPSREQVEESLEVVERIRRALKEDQPIVILGSPGSGKTEQMALAMGKRRYVVFDVRGQFLEFFCEANDVTDRARKKEIKNTYNTTAELKGEELAWLQRVLGERERGLLEGTDEIVVFDEFDLAHGECLSETELATARLTIDLADRLRSRGRTVVLIIHSKGLRTPGFVEHLVERGLLASRDAFIRTKYFERETEMVLLGFMGFDGNDALTLSEDFRGVPAAYLGLMRYLARLIETKEADPPAYRPSERELTDEAERSVARNYEIAKLTSASGISELLLELATERKLLGDIGDSELIEKLLDTGLVGRVNGELSMPPIIERVITNSSL